VTGGVALGVDAAAARRFVVEDVEDRCFSPGRAARRRGFVVGVADAALLEEIVEVVAGDCRAFAVVVATRGFRAVAELAGDAEESCDWVVRRGGGVDLGLAILAASRGFNGAGGRPYGRSRIVDMGLEMYRVPLHHDAMLTCPIFCVLLLLIVGLVRREMAGRASCFEISFQSNLDFLNVVDSRRKDQAVKGRQVMETAGYVDVDDSEGR